MEITQIKDCQKILKIAQELETEEERKCNKLFRDKSTIEWLSERKSNLDKEIKEIEGKILDKGGILSKQKLQESEKGKINNELESKTNNLNNIKVAESDKILQVKLIGQINEAENKIKEYESDIYDKGQSKYKVDEEIKNKETNVRNLEAHVSSARSELSSAETEFNSAQQRGSYNSCWGGYSPELSNACVQVYREKVQEKVRKQEKSREEMINAKFSLAEKCYEEQMLSDDIKLLNTKKNEEMAKKAQYEKERQEVEVKIQGVEVKIQGVLEQKKFLETEIEKQKAEQIKINEVLLSLEESAKNFDSSALETQKDSLEQEFQDAASVRHWVFKYQTTEIQEEIWK